jgi:energy-coupling factor transport system permease protein
MASSNDWIATSKPSFSPRDDAVSGNRLALLNPVTRLAAAIIVSLGLLVSLDWVSALVVVGWELFVVLGAGIPLGAMLKRLLPVIIAAPLAGVTMLLYANPGGTRYLEWGLVVISDASISYAVAIGVRVIALGLATAIVVWQVDPTDMADGLAQVAHLPARFVLGALAGVRLIGQLRGDMVSIELARRARGLGDGGRIKRYAGMAFALLVTAIRRGSTLATAMEARGFGAGPRTWARPSTISTKDGVALLVSVSITASSLVVAVAVGSFRWIGAV